MVRALLVVAMLVAMLAVNAGRLEAAAPPPGPAAPTSTDWVADLDAWAAGIAEKHVDPFRSCPRDRFDAAVAALRAALPAMSRPQALVGLARLAAMLDDSHTVLAVDRFPALFRPLPVRFACLDDGVFVIAATPEQRELLGVRVVAVGSTPIDEVVSRVTTIAAADNRGAALELVGGYGHLVELLEALEVIPADRAAVAVTVAAPTDGDAAATRVVELTPLPPGARADLAILGDDSAGEPPVSLRRRSGHAWFEPMLERNAVYFRYDACAESTPPMAELARDAVAMWRTFAGDGRTPRFVIDLRGNGGGNSQVLRPLIDALAAARAADPALRRDRSVVALIGPRTRSSASMNALELRRRAGAVLIGRPTGQRINHLGEVRTFTLPSSGLRATYSTKFFRHDPDNGADAVMPDVAVPRTSADVRNRRDAALEEALRAAGTTTR